MIINKADSVIRELRKYQARKKKNLERGIKAAALYVMAESQKLVPVDYGNLKSSADVRMTEVNGKPQAAILYTASYAIYVHEDMGTLHGQAFNEFYAKEIAAKPKHGPFRHSRGPNQSAKFLERPMREKRREIKAIIADAVRKT